MLSAARAVIVASAVALVSGCGTPTEEGMALIGGGGLETHAMRVQFDDGKPAWWISCPGAMNNIGACMERARAICGAPPELLTPSPQLAAGRTSERSLFVRCATQ